MFINMPVDFGSFSTIIIATILSLLSAFFFFLPILTTTKPKHVNLVKNFPEPNILCKNLASALPGHVIFPHENIAFKQSVNSYWAQQENEVIPPCVVRPTNVQQLSTAVSILKQEYDKTPKALFAVRSGGHNQVSGAASIERDVLIDLSLFCEVTLSEDKSSVVIGTGAKWMDVSKSLEEKGVAVVGGRNSHVGVGGLTLGGELHYFIFSEH